MLEEAIRFAPTCVFFNPTSSRVWMPRTCEKCSRTSPLSHTLGGRDDDAQRVVEVLRQQSDATTGNRYDSAETLTDHSFRESIEDATKLVAELDFLVFVAHWELGEVRSSTQDSRAIYDRILRHARQLHSEFQARPGFEEVLLFEQLLSKGVVEYFQRDATSVSVERKSRSWRALSAEERDPVMEVPLLIDRLRGDAQRAQMDGDRAFPSS